MKINNNMISIPPYISTSWRDVQSLHTKDGLLVVSLFNGETVEVPDLKLETIQLIFAAHEEFLEHHAQEDMVDRIEAQQQRLPGNMLQAFLTPQQISELPMRMNVNSLDNLGMVLQHNPAQASAPDLPPEMLEKISSFAKMITPEEQENLPKAEPHCNCLHCQIARVINESIEIPMREAEVEPKVADEDLKFKQWEIAQIGDHLFRVTNPIDHTEEYNVFLGEPIGCTCGHSGCEHIVAVLQS